MRSCLVAFLVLSGTAAKADICASDAGGQQGCHAGATIADATFMLQTKKLEAKTRQQKLVARKDSIEDESTCPLLTDAVWAAMDTYVEASYPFMMATPGLLSYGQKMKSAHWNLELQWVVVNKTTPTAVASTLFGFMNDTDYTGLWVNDGSCILAFRGSDSQIDCGMFPNAYLPEAYQQHIDGTPGAPNGVQWDAVDMHGLKVHLGVKVELEALLDKMSSDGLAKMKDTCTSGLTFTGHSLGGGTSQLLATLLNKKDDPLGAKLTVDHLFGFGPMPFSKGTAAENDQSPDGCFSGGMYANVEKKDSQGIPVVDLVWQMLTKSPGLEFKHVKTSHHLMVSPTEYIVTPCGEDPPYPYTGKSIKTSSMMPAHNQTLYVDNIGCPSSASAV